MIFIIAIYTIQSTTRKIKIEPAHSTKNSEKTRYKPFKSVVTPSAEINSVKLGKNTFRFNPIKPIAGTKKNRVIKLGTNRSSRWKLHKLGKTR